MPSSIVKDLRIYLEDTSLHQNLKITKKISITNKENLENLKFQI